MKRVHLQCGYEDECKDKKCLKCPRKKEKTLTLTLAEECMIEDLAVCDLQAMIDEKPEQIELIQSIAVKLMGKLFDE